MAARVLAPVLAAILCLAPLSIAAAAAAANDIPVYGCQGESSEPQGGLNKFIENTIVSDPSFDPRTNFTLSEYEYELMANRTGAAISAVLAGGEILGHFDPSESSFNASSVATGAAGRALFFLKLFKTVHRYQFYQAYQYLDHAHRSIDMAVALAPEGDLSNVGFLRGTPGVYGIASIIYSIVGEYTSAENMLIKLRHMIQDALEYDKTPMSFENGLAGLAYTVRFVNGFFQDEVISWSMYHDIIDRMIEFGYDNLVSEGGDVWSWPDPNHDTTTGLLLGDSGPLYTILAMISYDYEGKYSKNQTLMDKAKDTVEGIYNKEAKDKGFENIANLYDGAPGFIPVFWTAYRAFGDIKYYNASMDAALFTAQQGILETGMQMGVGTSGNAYMLLWLASEMLITQALDNSTDAHPSFDQDIGKLFAYANSMHKIALKTDSLSNPNKMVSYHCEPFTFWKDSPAGMAMAYTDLITHKIGRSDVREIHMPGFSELL